MHYQRQLNCRQCVWPPVLLVAMVTALIRCLVFKVSSLGKDSVGWILLFQPGSILHHYINTQCAGNDHLSGQDSPTQLPGLL